MEGLAEHLPTKHPPWLCAGPAAKKRTMIRQEFLLLPCKTLDDVFDWSVTNRKLALRGPRISPACSFCRQL